MCLIGVVEHLVLNGMSWAGTDYIVELHPLPETELMNSINQIQQQLETVFSSAINRATIHPMGSVACEHVTYPV